MRRQGRQGHGIKIGLATMAGLMLLAGCSSVPDAINPVEWYRGAASLFDEEEAPAPERTAGDRSSGDQAYPNLATVPARPTDISSPSERRAMRQGLVADRDQARYTDQQPSNAIGTGSTQASPPQTSASQTSASQTAPVRTPAAPPPPAAAPAPAAPAVAEPAPAAAVPPAQPAAPPAASPATPPAARIAPRAEAAEPLSAGAAMMERRRQEVLAERAAATPEPAAPRASAPQESAPAPAPESRPEPRPEPRTEARPESRAEARTAAEIYREQFARSASPVETRSAEPEPAVGAAASASAPAGAADRAGISYLAATILFGHGSTALDAAGQETLRKVAAEHRKNGGTLRIVGHASSRTTDMQPLQHQLANFQVSVSRAEAVAQELVRLGVPARAMEVAGVGDSQPIYYEVMPAGEAGNRRVEIFVDY